MKLNEKRKVIEVLLCAGGDDNNVSLNEAAAELLCADSMHAVLEESYRLSPPGTVRLGDRMSCVAYRLIESSPVLRREWFNSK